MNSLVRRSAFLLFLFSLAVMLAPPGSDLYGFGHHSLAVNFVVLIFAGFLFAIWGVEDD
jgi:hypothetical protein